MIENSETKTSKSSKTLTKEKIPPLSQLCWNCKRALNTKEHSCPWSKSGKPVKGWQAAERCIKEGNYPPMKTYYVTVCPMYEKDKPYMDQAELITYVAKRLGFCRVYIQRNYERMLKRFEAQTGEKLPAWAWEREYYRSKKGGGKDKEQVDE